MIDGSKKVVLTKKGFHDVVLWNPWAEKAKGMSDFADQEYQVTYLHHLENGETCYQPKNV